MSRAANFAYHFVRLNAEKRKTDQIDKPSTKVGRKAERREAEVLLDDDGALEPAAAAAAAAALVEPPARLRQSTSAPYDRALLT